MDNTKDRQAWWLKRGGRLLRPEELRAQMAGLTVAVAHARWAFDGEPLVTVDRRRAA